MWSPQPIDWNTKIEIGDLICFVENYSPERKVQTYGLVIEEKTEKKVRHLKIRWFDGWKSTWHPDPCAGPNWRIKNFYIVSKIKSRKKGE